MQFLELFSMFSSNQSIFNHVKKYVQYEQNQFIFTCVEEYNMRKINLFLQKAKINQYQIIQDYSGINDPY